MFQRLRQLKVNKAWVVLGVALVIGALAALAARNYLANQMEAIEARDRGNRINLVVAKHELKRGERLSSENVAVRPIPKDYAQSNAVAPDDFQRLDGRTLNYALKPGEMVLWSMLEGQKSPSFSARIDAGHRAITVSVDEINSISGMVEPGDAIDLFVSVDRQGRKDVLPLMRSVTVLATGQRAGDDPRSGERRQFTTVTLDTTPEQAESLLVARDAGRITATLRSPKDRLAVATLDASLARWRGLLGAASGTDSEVPVLFGGRAGGLPAAGLTLDRAHAVSSQAERPGISGRVLQTAPPGPHPTTTPTDDRSDR